MVKQICNNGIGMSPHGANFKKRLNCIKMAMFGAMIFAMEEITIHFIYMPVFWVGGGVSK